MNISYNWLKDLIDIELSADEVAKALTRVGLAVEGIEPHGADLILDIDLTSNRSDCLSHRGIARELGAITGKPLKTHTVAPKEAADPLSDPNAIPFPLVLAPEIVRIDAPDLCNRFTVRIIKGVKVGPSPQWLVDRLEALGERSINNIADITNYVMLELGQPMHAFDLDKIKEHRLVVRTAVSGETIKTLDEVERKLDESMLMICDAEKPVAVAGIMGGFDSAISDETTNVLLEVAYFKRESIRQTSRKLSLSTEASHRFERGVDIENLKRASDLATELIVLLAGGNAAEIVDIYPQPQAVKEINSASISDAVKRLTGLEVAEDECVALLSKLGISSQTSGVYLSPTWRHDIAIEEDLVEEVARHAGYENIKEELPPAFGSGEYQAGENRKKRLRQTFATLGFNEAIGYSFIDEAKDGIYQFVPELVNTDLAEPFVTLQDSVIEGAVRMRPSLLPGLIDAVRHNLNFQIRDLRLFEIGKVFSSGSAKGDLPNERELLAFVLTGASSSAGRFGTTQEIDFYDASGILEAGIEAVGAGQFQLVEADVKHLRRGQSAVVLINGQEVGSIGRLNEEISGDYKFRQPVYVAEIDLQKILSAQAEPVRYEPLPKYPSVTRDVSFVVKRGVSFGDIRSTVNSLQIPICQSIAFVDQFKGKGLGDGETSLTVRIGYRSDERTLIENEVNDAHNAVLSALSDQLGISQRT